MDNDFEDMGDTPEAESVEDQETDTLDDEGEGIEHAEYDQFEEDDEEADPPEAEEAEEGTAEDVGSEDDQRVSLDDGEEVTIGELKRGYFREADYTQKTTQIAEERKALDEVRQSYAARVQDLDARNEQLAGFLAGLIPPEPDAALARSNPGEYTHLKALRDSAIAEIGAILDMKQDLRATQQGYSDEDFQRLKSEEDQKLLKAMPQLSEPGRRAAFDKSIRDTAVEFGFSEEEVSGAVDHRMFMLVHYAKIGKLAERNRANAKRRRAESPKTAKPRPASQSQRSHSNRQALERLRKTGSIEDAMKIDSD